MKNVVFVSLPKVETLYPPGAIAVLSSIADKHDFESRVFDYNLELSQSLTKQQWHELELWNTLSAPEISTELEKQLREIFEHHISHYIDADTQYVCFTVFSYFSHRIATKVLWWFKQISNIESVVGGVGVSTKHSEADENYGDFLIRNQLAHYVVFGEGELTFDAILTGRFDYAGINQNNPVQIDDLASLPTPTYRYFDMSKYQQKKILITGSRGCVRQCTFCDIDLTWPKFRYRNAKHIVDEIVQHYYDYGITEFEFTDSLINGSISNFNEFNERLYEAKQHDPALQNIKYHGQFICRPREHQKEHTYELMHLAGCQMLITGIESFSNNVRHHMRKKFSNDDIDYHFEQCGRWGIPNVVLMVVGYPTETEQDHNDNLIALKKYKKYADMGVIFKIRWGLTMHLYEHTPIMGMIDQLQLTFDHNIKYDSIYSWSSLSNPNNTIQERIRRRLEIHELCVELGYPMPRVKEELLILKTLAEQSKQSKSKIFSLKAA